MPLLLCYRLYAPPLGFQLQLTRSDLRKRGPCALPCVRCGASKDRGHMPLDLGAYGRFFLVLFHSSLHAKRNARFERTRQRLQPSFDRVRQRVAHVPLVNRRRAQRRRAWSGQTQRPGRLRLGAQIRRRATPPPARPQRPLPGEGSARADAPLTALSEAADSSSLAVDLPER